MWWLNIIFPGAGLLLRGRLLSGALILVLSMGLLGLLVLAPFVTIESFAAELCLQLGLAYIGLALSSSLWHWFSTRRPPLDFVQLRRLHQEACLAFLNNNFDGALSAAQRICGLAANVIGSWQLLALVAEAKGDSSLARMAHKRALALQEQDEDL